VNLDRVRAAQRDLASMSRKLRADLLDAIGVVLAGRHKELVDIAHDETGISEQRLAGELTRTSYQLAELACAVRAGHPFDEEECSEVPGDPPAGGPAIARVWVPIGPVVNFEASNFPFAFGIAGCDTAAALAAGSAVIVKIHPAHPRTSRGVLALSRQAAVDLGLSRDTLSAVEGLEEGLELVAHPDVQAVAFTGSLDFGDELRRLCQRRTPPIPFFGELGSVNPVVVAEDAARSRGWAIATAYVASLTINMGQLCTKPGLFFVPRAASNEIVSAIVEGVTATPGTRLISRAIAERAAEHHRDLEARGLETLARSATVDEHELALPYRVYRVSANGLAFDATLAEEHFGPTGIVVEYSEDGELESALAQVRGSLTMSLHADDLGCPPVPRLLARAMRTAGRVIVNGFPTGLPVRDATHHGGPYPAATDAHATSVGAHSIRRFLRPVSIQGSTSDLAAVRAIGASGSNQPSIWA
jgi:NADP-dependent aldehyde dehydrogenase